MALIFINLLTFKFMTKFKFMVADSINQEELSKVFGGESSTSNADASVMGSACNQKACSKRTEAAGNFCTYGDGICKSNIA